MQELGGGRSEGKQEAGKHLRSSNKRAANRSIDTEEKCNEMEEGSGVWSRDELAEKRTREQQTVTKQQACSKHQTATTKVA